MVLPIHPRPVVQALKQSLEGTGGHVTSVRKMKAMVCLAVSSGIQYLKGQGTQKVGNIHGYNPLTMV